MITVIGLDLSLLSTGVCIIRGDSHDKISVETSTIPQPKVKGEKEELDRLINICSSIVQTTASTRPDMVVIEAPAKNQVWQMARVGGLHYCVRMQLYLACNIVPCVEEASRLRKHVVGSIKFKFEESTNRDGKTTKKVDYGKVEGKNGRIRKATIKDVIENRLKEQGFQFSNQDEMDAYVCARYGWDKLVSDHART